MSGLFIGKTKNKIKLCLGGIFGSVFWALFGAFWGLSGLGSFFHPFSNFHFPFLGDGLLSFLFPVLFGLPPVRATPLSLSRLPTFAVYLLRGLRNLNNAKSTYDAGGQLVSLSLPVDLTPTFPP